MYKQNECTTLNIFCIIPSINLCGIAVNNQGFWICKNVVIGTKKVREQYLWVIVFYF